jgi:hypothetical protein
MKYWVQYRTKAGNWVDSMGTNDLNSAKGFALFLCALERSEAQVVERLDTPVYNTAQPKSACN